MSRCLRCGGSKKVMGMGFVQKDCPGCAIPELMEEVKPIEEDIGEEVKIEEKPRLPELDCSAAKINPQAFLKKDEKKGKRNK
jgi:hypothetical protein